jgi:hypothetical protein
MVEDIPLCYIIKYSIYVVQVYMYVQVHLHLGSCTSLIFV